MGVQCLLNCCTICCSLLHNKYLSSSLDEAAPVRKLKLIVNTCFYVDGQFILLLPVGVGIVAVYIFRRLVMLLLSRRPRLRRRHNGTAVAPATRTAPAAADIRCRRIGRPLVPVRPVFTVTFVAEHDAAAGAAGPGRRPRAAGRASAGRPGAALLTGTHTVTHGHEGGNTFSSVLGLKRRGKEC